MAAISIIGHNGFLGSAIARSYPFFDTYPTPETKVLFHFGSVVHTDFERSPEYHRNEMISSFRFLLPYCKKHNILLVYPSSALVYEKKTEFSKMKMKIEDMASEYDNTLGLRIFPVYGPGEHRTAIHQWCKAMSNGEQPTVYGDGSQYRDFIYINNVVEAINNLVIQGKTGIYDIGLGKPHTFNEIIQEINNILGTHIEPKYIPIPKGYSEGIFCHNPVPETWSLHDGLCSILGK